MQFFLDESGNTGDLQLTKPSLDFGGQPVFSLACIGISDELNAGDFIKNLKIKYNIRSNEIKATKLIKSKPNAVMDLIGWICENDVPYFIELVDKKYQLAVNIVGGFVNPPYFNTKIDQRTIDTNLFFSDFLYKNLKNECFYEFIECMNCPSNERVLKFFFSLRQAVGEIEHIIVKGIISNIDESLDDFRIIEETEHEEAYKKLLPLPDHGKRNQIIWMLPNYSSFTNIYARVNAYMAGDLSKVRFLHDQQSHFDQVIVQAKEQMEEDFIESYIPSAANYNIKVPAELSFGVSEDSVGIQIADLLAGVAMRWLQSLIRGDHIDDVLLKSIEALNRSSDERRCVGINVVGFHNHAYKLFGERGY